MLPSTVLELVKGMVEVDGEKITAVVENKLLSSQWDEVVVMAVFGSEVEKSACRWLIWEVGQCVGVRPASINDLYMARGRKEVPLDFTVPAMNLRGMGYDMARSVFKAAKNLKVGALICELARSEMGYTDQSPVEYVAVVLAGAIREGWRGGLCVQADHFQAKALEPGKPKEGEIEAIKELTEESIKAGFYNIDIDMSTLVDLDKKSEKEQQFGNIKYSLELAKSIREVEPEGVTVSIGGEIGHIGGKNSTIEDFEAYIKGFNQGLGNLTGMSKISVATGTHHGGVVLADGSLADISVDFKVLGDISKACRSLKISGAVQHGASTLPDQFFKEFVKAEAIEVHLATGFQNIMMDHKSFPKELLEKMYRWLDEKKVDERKEDQTDEQFHYKLRKKAWGEFKKECWDIDEKAREEIREDLEKRFEFLFKELNVINTEGLAKKWIKAVEIHKTVKDFTVKQDQVEEVRGLSD
ncbi:MAG: class II fructose-bisphosphate aldolase [Candidatus Beckwithbacteria bacterium]|nr:class II fructose-bisphosphate aldolase [Patescibacteria group bacterium]